MRALRVESGRLVSADVPTPAADGEALVVSVSGICNTDLEIARGYMGSEGTLGHELVGVIEAGGGELPVGTTRRRRDRQLALRQVRTRLALLEAGAVDVDSLVSERFSRQDGLRAMQTASKPGVLKVLLD